MRESTLKRLLRKPNIKDHLELHRVDCLSSHRDLAGYRFCIRKLREFRHASLAPRPLIRGKDLVESGYHPGPIFRRILTVVEDLQLEGKLHTREEALDYVRRKFPLESALSGEGGRQE